MIIRDISYKVNNPYSILGTMLEIILTILTILIILRSLPVFFLYPKKNVL